MTGHPVLRNSHLAPLERGVHDPSEVVDVEALRHLRQHDLARPRQHSHSQLWKRCEREGCVNPALLA